MYHNKKGRKLGRRPDHRKAMLRNLVISLIEAGRIETTVTRAKEVRRKAERLITYAKRGDLHGRRLIIAALGNNKRAAAKLVDEIAPRYTDRQGGYTRILKTGFRRGDAAPTALIEWVEEELPRRRKQKAKRQANQKAPREPQTTGAMATEAEMEDQPEAGAAAVEAADTAATVNEGGDEAPVAEAEEAADEASQEGD